MFNQVKLCYNFYTLFINYDFFMAAKNNNIGLIVAIIFASSVISGSLVYFGMQVAGRGTGNVTVEMLEQAFDNYVKKQQQKQADSQQADTQKKQEMVKNVKPVSPEDHIRGNKDATISLIEYSDYECPFCKKFHPMAQEVMRMYGNDINWVYRHYPLDFHDPMATNEAMASECVAELGGNDAFWEYTDLIYTRTKSNGHGLALEDLPKMAAEVGVNSEAFQKCLDSGKYRSKVQKDIAEGSNAGVQGTPGSILVNNKTGEAILIEGAQDPTRYFKPAIDQLLK